MLHLDYMQIMSEFNVFVQLHIRYDQREPSI